jgi:hypothetical protein
MNLIQINEVRAKMGLAPVQGDPRKQERAKQRAANLARRAQESRDLKAKRNASGKGR